LAPTIRPHERAEMATPAAAIAEVLMNWRREMSFTG
jgi:hypothetical protein